MKIRGIEFGGAKPLFCVPLVAANLNSLLKQATAARELAPDLVEWRADSYVQDIPDAFGEAARQLRSALVEMPVIFTLRMKSEGGAQPLDQDFRSRSISAVLHSRSIDIVDLELRNGREFLSPLIESAHTNAARVMLSFHDFRKTGTNNELMATITALANAGCDIAKVAYMPQTAEDVLRLLHVTLIARQAFPALPLCTMSMGKLGLITRVAGFLYGSDMAFAVSQGVSAPGQIPLLEARAITEKLLAYSWSSKEPLVSQDTIGPMRHSLDPDHPPPIVVAAGLWPYQVIVGWENLGGVAEQIRRVLPQARHAAVLTDRRVWCRVGVTLEQSLETAGLKVDVREVVDDESIKTHEQVNNIHDWLLAIHFRRNDVLLIVGGGAIDDVGGFAASTYMRGVAMVKVPTSLEGMVDTSIGGKTALNHPRARNLIGTFYHPRLVWTDAALLRDEPEDELRAAWAEVVKYAMLESSLLRDEVAGASLFDVVSSNVEQLMALDKHILLNIIARCVALKAQVVASDERDFAEHRMLLNYGHTIGHALETSLNYALPHGNAVSIGMAIEAGIAVRLGLASAGMAVRQNELLTRYGLPTKLPKVSIDVLLARIRNDKKVFGDSPRWILPVEVGRAVVSSSVSEDDLVAVIEEHSSETLSKDRS